MSILGCGLGFGSLLSVGTNFDEVIGPVLDLFLDCDLEVEAAASISAVGARLRNLFRVLDSMATSTSYHSGGLVVGSGEVSVVSESLGGYRLMYTSFSGQYCV